MDIKEFLKRVEYYDKKESLLLKLGGVNFYLSEEDGMYQLFISDDGGITMSLWGDKVEVSFSGFDTRFVVSRNNKYSGALKVRKVYCFDKESEL